MNMYVALFLLTWVISLIGYLWLAIVAFKRSVLWGVLVLLLSPITAIVYSLLNWFEARKAFIVYMVAFVVCAGIGVYMYGVVGVGNMQEIATRLHSGKLAPAKAYQLILKAMGPARPTDLFADEAPPVPAASAAPLPVTSEELAHSEQQAAAAVNKPAAATTQVSAEPASTATSSAVKPAVVAEQAKTETKTTDNTKDKPEKPAANAEKPNPKIPNPNQVPPDPLAQKPFKPEPNTVVVRMEKLPHYIGHYFIITLKSGSQQRGLLRKVDDHQLILDRKLYGGNFQYKILKSQIKSIHMLTRLPDER
jgi:hypothetical protein